MCGRQWRRWRLRALINSAAAVLDGKLYAVGVYNGDHLSSVERYDPAANVWEAVAPRSAVFFFDKKEKTYTQGRDGRTARRHHTGI